MHDQHNELLKQIVRNTESTAAEVARLREDHHEFQLQITKEIERLEQSPRLVTLGVEMAAIKKSEQHWIEWREDVDKRLAKHDKYFFAIGALIALIQALPELIKLI